MTKCQKPMLKEVLRYFRAPSCQRKLPIVERLHESEHVPLEEPDVDTGGAGQPAPQFDQSNKPPVDPLRKSIQPSSRALEEWLQAEAAVIGQRRLRHLDQRQGLACLLCGVRSGR